MPLDRVGLAAGAAAGHGDDGVVAPGGAGLAERLEGVDGAQQAPEVGLELLAVHDDLAFAGAQEHARDGGLAAAGAVELLNLLNRHDYRTSSFWGFWAAWGCVSPA